ncbi:MAG TPA: hypothetical protein VHN38_01345, partial [Immundisolibacter sp.]|nr:hypothetical protein [Immundisolibacter sp.]
MTVRTVAELRALFETGDRPSQQDFVDLIDSFLHAQLSNFPNPLPAVSAANLTNIPIPDPLPAVSGEFLTNINRSDWVAIDAVPSYATSTSFVVSGDYTGVGFFVVGVRLRIHLNPDGYHFTSVLSATYAAGPDTTTVVVADEIPTSALAAVDVNLLVDSDIVVTSLQPGSGDPLTVYRKNAGGTAIEPWAIPVGSATEPALVELATDAETQALADATRAVTPAGLAAAAVSAATADRLMRRDAAGRAQVAAPSVAADIARKDTVDAVQASADGHAALTNPHGATSAATASRLVLRDAAGRAQVAAPSVSADLANKGYVDAVIPSGTKMVFAQAAAPTGWTQDASVNDRVLRVVSGAGAGVGGSWTISGLTVGGTALTINEMPLHGHPYIHKTNIEGGTGNDNSGVLLTDTGISREVHGAYTGWPSAADG